MKQEQVRKVGNAVAESLNKMVNNQGIENGKAADYVASAVRELTSAMEVSYFEDATSSQLDEAFELLRLSIADARDSIRFGSSGLANR